MSRGISISIPVAKFTQGAQVYALRRIHNSFTFTRISKKVRINVATSWRISENRIKAYIEKWARNTFRALRSPFRRHDPTSTAPAAAMGQVPAGAASVSVIWEPPRCLSASRQWRESPLCRRRVPSAVLPRAVCHWPLPTVRKASFLFLYFSKTIL